MGTLRIKPPALRPGDLIGIVAPASTIKSDMLAEGCRELERLGFRTLCRPGITTSYPYLSGTDERRAAELLKMIRNPEVRAIFCARCGSGSARIIPYLEPELVRSNPKIINRLEEVVMDVLAATAFPVLYGFSTGHTSRANVVVPFGVRARLSLGSNSAFELLEPAVAS